MSEIRSAYQSLHPDIAAPAVLAAERARRASLDAIEEFTNALFGPLTDEPVSATATFGFDGSIYPTGFEAAEGFTGNVPLPTGTRYDTRSRRIVPAKRTDEGKVIAADLARLAFTQPLIDGLGGIVFGFMSETPPSNGAERHASTCYSTGFRFHVYEDEAGAVQVFATLPVGCLDTRPGRGEVDESRWKKARLSIFHAAREAHEDRHRESAQVG